MTELEKPIPCRFCGNKHPVLSAEDDPASGDYMLVTCQKCEASAYLDVWNRKPLEEV